MRNFIRSFKSEKEGKKLLLKSNKRKKWTWRNESSSWTLKQQNNIKNLIIFSYTFPTPSFPSVSCLVPPRSFVCSSLRYSVFGGETISFSLLIFFAFLIFDERISLFFFSFDDESKTKWKNLSTSRSKWTKTLLSSFFFSPILLSHPNIYV